MNSNDDSKDGMKRVVVDELATTEPRSPIFAYVNAIARDWPRYRDEFRRAAMARLRSHKWIEKSGERLKRFGEVIYLRQADGSEKLAGIGYDQLGGRFILKSLDEDRAEELASAIIMLLLDDTIDSLRQALAPSKAPFDFAVGDNVSIFTGDHVAVSVVAYAGANAFRHVKEWERFLTADHEFDLKLIKPYAKRNIEALQFIYGARYPVTERPCSHALRAIAGTEAETYAWREGVDRDSWELERNWRNASRPYWTLLERLLSVAKDAGARFGCDKNDFGSAVESATQTYKPFSAAIVNGRRSQF